MRFESLSKLALVVSIMLALGGLVVVSIANTSLWATNPLVYAIRAFPAVSFGLLGLFAILVWVALFVIGVMKRQSWTRALRSSFSLLVVAIGLFAVSLASTVGGSLVQWSDVPAPQEGQLRILSWNTGNTVSEDLLLKQAIALQPDIIFYPEQDQAFSQGNDCDTVDQSHQPGQTGGSDDSRPKLCAIASALGMRVYYVPDAAQSTLLIKRSLGEYAVTNNDAPNMAFAGFLATPKQPESNSPTLFLAHIQRPEFGIGTSWWSAHIEWARSACDSPNVIAAGDFNATLANLGGDMLGHCRDVASQLGVKTAGTWPTFLPASFGSTIDHVFTGSSYRPVYYSVLDTPSSSDHRAIFAILNTD